ncbi:MAG: hypothetical protein R3B67_12990 [Phycisphaerales bacterium]
MKRTSLLSPTLALTALALSLSQMSGCIVGAAIGGMAESYKRTGSTEIEAEYEGLIGKSFAVVVSADRVIEGNNPGISARINQRVNDRIIQNAGAAFAIPSADLLTVLYNTPQWPAMTRGEVAEMLGVERLVVVELVEYRLNEPGNKYIWDGSASCVVSVYESDSPFPDDPVFEKAIRVSFPDTSGLMRTEIPEAAVNTELANRITNRISWLFYTHEESNVIPY